jgi:hypothetical protein
MPLVFTQRFVRKPINGPKPHAFLVCSITSSNVVAILAQFLAGAALLKNVVRSQKTRPWGPWTPPVAARLQK